MEPRRRAPARGAAAPPLKVMEPGRRAALRAVPLVVVFAMVLCLVPQTGLRAQDVRVTERFPAGPLALGEQAELVIELRGLPTLDVSIREPDYPAVVEKLSGPEVSSRVVDQGTSVRRDVEVRIEIRARSPGRGVLEPFVVRAGSTRYSTEQRLIEVGRRGEPGAVPFTVRWRTGTRTLYQGQTASVSLEMDFVPEFVYPSSIDISPPDGALFEEVQGVGSVETRELGGRTLYRYPVATFLMTPSRTGTLSVPAATVEALGFTREAEAMEVAVREVPEPVSATGAVGDFAFSAAVDRSRLGVGERVTLSLEVSGTGNLTFLQFPDIEAGGLVRTATDEREQFEPTVSGYRGRRTRTVELTPQETGLYRITVPGFVWYDPGSERVRRTGSEQFQIAVGSALSTEDGSLDEAAPDLRLLSLREVERIQPLDLYQHAPAYGLFLPALLVLVGIFLYRQIMRRGAITLFSLVLLVFLVASGMAPDFPSDSVSRGVETYHDGDASASIEHFREALERAPESPGVLYNLAVAEYAGGREGEAVFHMREALRLLPRFREARAALAELENVLDLRRQVTPARGVHPDVFFFAALGLFYLLCVLLLLPGKRRQGFYYVFVILCGLAFVASAVAIPVTADNRETPVAVVSGTPGVLRKVPDPAGERWLTLPEGTAVDLIASHRDFYLVHTAFGVRGWIETGELLHSGRSK